MPTYASNPRSLLDPRTVSMADKYAEKAWEQVFDHNLALNIFFNIDREPNVIGPKIQTIIKAMGASKPVLRYESNDYVQFPLLFGQSTNTMEFDSGDILRTNIDENMTKAFSDWAFYTDYATLYWTDVIRNSGPARLLNRQMEQIDAMYRSMSYYIETDFWGTQTDIAIGTQKKIPGIQHLISTAPTTGTRWGVNAANFTQWRNQYDTVGSFATNGLDKLDSIYQNCSGNVGLDNPNLNITTYTVWRYYGKQTEGHLRITGNLQSPDLGVGLLYYKNMPVLHCNQVASGYWYMLNTDYLRMFINENANFEVDKPPSPNNQKIAMQTRCSVGMTWGCVEPRRQGVLSGITA